MKLARLAAAAVVCVTLALVAASGASADPKAPGSESVTFVCDGVPITLTLLPRGGSAAFTASTSVGVSVGIVITDAATGEELFSALTPGFEHNVLETVTCTHTFGGEEVAVTAFFTPASP